MSLIATRMAVRAPLEPRSRVSHSNLAPHRPHTLSVLELADGSMRRVVRVSCFCCGSVCSDQLGGVFCDYEKLRDDRRLSAQPQPLALPQSQLRSGGG
jgi:hypothetical protein